MLIFPNELWKKNGKKEKNTEKKRKNKGEKTHIKNRVGVLNYGGGY